MCDALPEINHAGGHDGAAIGDFLFISSAECRQELPAARERSGGHALAPHLGFAYTDAAPAVARPRLWLDLYVNYRLSDEAHFPAQMKDVKTAVRWPRAHARQYRYDPAKIAAVGDSAGGQLVALLGTSEGVNALEGTQLGNPGISSSVKAAVVLYPDINFLAEETWLSQIPACAGRFANPNLPGSAASRYLGGPGEGSCPDSSSRRVRRTALCLTKVPSNSTTRLSRSMVHRRHS